MKKNLKWVLTIIIVFGFVFSFLFFLENEKNQRLQKQLIAVCGVIDEVVNVPNLTISPADDPEEVISIELSSLPEESFPWREIFTIRSDGTIRIDNIGGWGERDSEKSWKDYPKFAKIGKK